MHSHTLGAVIALAAVAISLLLLHSESLLRHLSQCDDSEGQSVSDSGVGPGPGADSATASESDTLLQTVPRIEWLRIEENAKKHNLSPGQYIYQTFSSPTVLTESPATHWTAVAGPSNLRWTPHTLLTAAATAAAHSNSARRWPEFAHVKSRKRSQADSDNVFMYTDPDRPLTFANFPSDSPGPSPPKHNTISMTAREFLQTLQSAESDCNSSDLIYFSDGISILRQTGHDVLPLDPLALNADQDAGQCDVNVWFGTMNVTAYPHYDLYENLFVQIFGEKEFILAAPVEDTGQATFPFLHEASRQLQHDSLSLSKRTSHIQYVMLQPGEALYLPPLHIHRVRAHSPVSISVNIWCNSHLQSIKKQLLEDIPLPFETHWNATVKMAAAVQFVRAIQAHSTSHSAISSVNQMLRKRYNCHTQTSAILNFAEVCPSIPSKPLSWFHPQFEERAEAMASLSSSVTLLADHVELILQWAVPQQHIITTLPLLICDCI
jgi:Cupin-like domain